MTHDIGLQGIYGAVWCLIAFYGAALYGQMRRLPAGHVFFSLLFLAVACVAMSLIGGFFVFLIPDILLGIVLYRAWAYGPRRGMWRISPAGRFAVGFLLCLVLLVVLLVGCVAVGEGFIVLWPFVSVVLVMLLPRRLKVPMLKSLPMGEYMGWDDIFPERLRYRRRKRNDGFLLIEAVIALAVLGICLGGLLSLTSCRTKLRAAAERAAMVRIAAQSEMERIKSRPFDALQVGTSRTFPIQLPEGTGTGRVLIEKHAHPGVKRIRVVTGEEGAMEIERIELVTLVADRKGANP